MRILKRLIDRKLRFVRNVLPKYVYKSGFLSHMYYLLFDRSFDREMKAVLAGRVKHQRDSEMLKTNYFLVVRNIHRLEKGLLMRPRRNVFAKDFIGETINSFEGVWKSGDINHNPQMKWFYDVLNEYFLTSGDDPLIKKYEDIFYKILNSESSDSIEKCLSKSIPYFRSMDDLSNISYDEFYKLTKQRRSVRWYLEKPVPRELIDRAVLAANLSPSACNRQPFEFKIFDDPILLDKIVKVPMGTRGYGHSIPVMIVIVGNLDAYFDERDRHIIYIDASLAAMTLMLALETMGISSCAINWPDIELKEREMEELLNLKPFQRPIMCMGLGYADPEGMVAFSEKRPLSQIRSYNN